MKFALLPSLRVTRVTGEKGQDLHFIQENRKEDGSFYAVLDEAAPIGKLQSITVDYGGDKVLTNAGSGSYYVGSRDSWYPNLNGFGEKALYDLTFKVPHSNVLISVGKQDDEHTEAGFSVTLRPCPLPWPDLITVNTRESIYPIPSRTTTFPDITCRTCRTA
jgi:hypothetical protein